MNRNYLIAFAATAALLGLMFILAWSFLETYTRERWVPPSREARINEYLALDRWLENMGRPVRVESSGNLSMISRAEERQIFVQSSLFYWTPDAVEYLTHWIEEGGTLFLVLDYYAEWEYWIDTGLVSLLDKFGIEAKTGTGLRAFRYDDQAPSFSHDFSFELAPDDTDVLELKDWTGLTRFVQVKYGLGKLIVSGRPRFLLSPYIGETPNARLSMAIFGTTNFGAGNNDGWLFIRGSTRARGLLGSLFLHGNLKVLGVSALVLLVVGFWTVIPIFGLVRRDLERPGKSLRERFIAEGRFLKRYGALGFYRDNYVREIRRRLAKKEGLATEDEIIRKALCILGKTGEERESQLLIAALRGEPFTYSEFPKMISMFKTILERI